MPSRPHFLELRGGKLYFFIDRIVNLSVNPTNKNAWDAQKAISIHALMLAAVVELWTDAARSLGGRCPETIDAGTGDSSALLQVEVGKGFRARSAGARLLRSCAATWGVARVELQHKLRIEVTSRSVAAGLKSMRPLLPR